MRDGADRPVLDVERPAVLAEEDLDIVAAAVGCSGSIGERARS
jgi:hypothetical protein